jgi:hypothetical protein
MITVFKNYISDSTTRVANVIYRAKELHSYKEREREREEDIYRHQSLTSVTHM